MKLWFVVRKDLAVVPEDGSTYMETTWHKYLVTVGQEEENQMSEVYAEMCDAETHYIPMYVAAFDPEDVEDVVNELRDGLGRFMTGERFDGSESIDRELDEVWE